MSDEHSGMTVDGDMLHDLIVEAVPAIITEEEARAIAGRTLDGAVRAGMTVLHGPAGTPRAAVCGAPDGAGELRCARPVGHPLSAHGERHRSANGDEWVTEHPGGVVS